MNAKDEIAAAVPTDLCDECGQMKPSYGFVSLTAEGGGLARRLCARCYNADYMKRAGLPPLETVDFEPIVRHTAVGKARTFHFAVHMSTGLGLRAFELMEGHAGGYQFFVLEPPETPVREAYEKLVRKIEAGIAVRYLRASDFPGWSQNRLHIKGTAVNGRIDENEDGPVVVVDGQELTWEAFGQVLSSCMGFNFRLEIFDACENPETTGNPQRPNPVWWLPETQCGDPEDRHHH